LVGQNGSRSEQLDLSWQPQRTFVVSLMCTICIEGPPRQFDALLARLYQQSMLIFATIALSPKSALKLFQWRSLWCVLSSDSSSLAYWNLRWTVLKPYILSQCHKRLILGIQRTVDLRYPKNYFCYWALSAKTFDDRSSIILCTWIQHRGHFENMTVY